MVIEVFFWHAEIQLTNILTINTDSKAIACQLSFDNHVSLITCVFIVHQIDPWKCYKLLWFFKSIVEHYLCLPICITGDLNLSNIYWEINHTNGSAYPSDLCELIIDFILEHGFTQSVDAATREKKILSIFFTNRPSLIKICLTVLGTSDQEALFIESFITLTLQQPKPRKIIYCETQLMCNPLKKL